MGGRGWSRFGEAPVFARSPGLPSQSLSPAPATQSSKEVGAAVKNESHSIRLMSCPLDGRQGKIKFLDLSL